MLATITGPLYWQGVFSASQTRRSKHLGHATRKDEARCHTQRRTLGNRAEPTRSIQRPLARRAWPLVQATLELRSPQLLVARCQFQRIHSLVMMRVVTEAI